MGKKSLHIFLATSFLCLLMAFVSFAEQRDVTVYDGYPGHIGNQLDVLRINFGDRFEPKSVQYWYQDGENRKTTLLKSFAYIQYNDTPEQSAWYYLGDAANRWVQFNGKWYRTGGIRQVMTGPVWADGAYYYFDPVEYTMCTSGETVINGKEFIICSDGVCRPKTEAGYANGLVSGATNSGWDQENGKWIFLRNGSKVKSEWVQDGGVWYYLGEDGYMLSNTSRVINGVKYFFYSNGAMCANTTVVIDGKQYQADGNGALTLLDNGSDPVSTRLRMINETRQAGGQTAFIHDSRLDTLARQTSDLIEANKRQSGTGQIGVSSVYMLAVFQGMNVSHIGYIDCLSDQWSLSLSGEAEEALRNPMFTHVGFYTYANGLKTTIVFASF